MVYAMAMALIVRGGEMQQKLVIPPPDSHAKPGSLKINKACNFMPASIIAGTIFSHSTPQA